MSRARPQQVKEFAEEEISANFAACERLSARITANLGGAPVWCCSVDAYGLSVGVIPNDRRSSAGGGILRGSKRPPIRCARDPFDFAQRKLFAPPEKRLRSG